MGEYYRQLTLEERCTIARLHENGQSYRTIAASLGRAPSTVAREITRNKANQAGYRPAYADELAWGRRWHGSRLERQPDLQQAVLTRLAMGWSPEQTAGRLARENGGTVISHESIYRFIYAQIRRTKNYDWRHYLPRAKFKRGYRGRKGGSSIEHIKHRVCISQRPKSVEKRRNPGHWEADLLMFSNRRGNILVAQERLSRFTLLARLKDKKAAAVSQTLSQWFETMPPKLRRTLTQDNGTEFADHHKLNAALDLKTYFCKPRSPWQKGGVENMNGRLRRYLPRKLDPSGLSGYDVTSLAQRMNATPRKCLGFQTPAEVFSAHLLHFKCESTFPPSRGRQRSGIEPFKSIR